MKKLNIFLFLAGVASLTSCLKAGKENFPQDGSPMTVQWTTTALDDAPTNSASNIYRTYNRSYPLGNAIQMNIAVDITGGSTSSSDITVGITGVNQAAIDAYNAKYFTPTTGYTMLPKSLYTMPTSVVIPAGQRSATVSIVLNTNGFDFSQSYAIPVTITSTTQGQISANYGTVLYTVGAKNKYDGIWSVNGTMVDLSSSALIGRYPFNYYLETQSLTSDAMFDYAYGNGFDHAILSVGATATTNSSYGTYGPVFTFDPATNKITSVVNIYGQPAANGRSAALDPTGTNGFITGSPGTVGAQFQVSYFMNQPSVVAVGPRVKFNETWTYVGPRP